MTHLLMQHRCVSCCYQQGLRCKAKHKHIEPPDECQVDELNVWLLEEEPELELDEKREWLLRWSNRRAASVEGKAIDALKNVLSLLERDPRKDYNAIVAIYQEVTRVLRQCREDVDE